jgi:acyl-CoA hydrolase
MTSSIQNPIEREMNDQISSSSADSVPYRKVLLVRPEFLNHSGTLFGGYLMQWADEMAYIAASLKYPHSQFVTKLFGEFNFVAPVRMGEIITLFSEGNSEGTTSCTVKVWAVNETRNQEVFRTQAVMVNVIDGKKQPIVKPPTS